MARVLSSPAERNDPNTARYESLTLMCAGIVAAATLTVLMAIARSLGLLSLNLEVIIGSFALGYLGPSPWLVGFVLHLAFGAIIALGYGAVFRRLGAAGPSIGAGIGVAQWILLGLALGFISHVHPLMPESLLPPGFFAINSGTFGFFFIFLLQLVFGAIVGSYYRQVCIEHRSLTSRPV